MTKLERNTRVDDSDTVKPFPGDVFLLVITGFLGDFGLLMALFSLQSAIDLLNGFHSFLWVIVFHSDSPFRQVVARNHSHEHMVSAWVPFGSSHRFCIRFNHPLAMSRVNKVEQPWEDSRNPVIFHNGAFSNSSCFPGKSLTDYRNGWAALSFFKNVGRNQ